MTKLTIINRKGQKVALIIEANKNPSELAFVVHGLGGFKEQLHIAAFAQAFKDKDFAVVRFDATNSFGKSDGNYENATTINYYEDLEDVIGWARTQSWYKEPFYLAGHSLGGISVILYAERFPEKVRGLAPISTVVSGELSIKVAGEKNIKNWEKTGWREEKSESIPGLVKKLKWSHMVDRLKYNILPKANKLAMPTLLIVGDKDDKTPLKHQKMLFDKLSGKKELHILENADHNFRGPNYKRNLEKIRVIFTNWISKTQLY